MVYEKPEVTYHEVIAVHQNARQSDIDRGACVFKKGSDGHVWYFKDQADEPEDRGRYEEFMDRLRRGRVMAVEYEGKK